MLPFPFLHDKYLKKHTQQCPKHSVFSLFSERVPCLPCSLAVATLVSFVCVERVSELQLTAHFLSRMVSFPKSHSPTASKNFSTSPMTATCPIETEKRQPLSVPLL